MLCLVTSSDVSAVSQAALVRKDDEMDRELRSLRQQHEQLTAQFRARKPLM